MSRATYSTGPGGDNTQPSPPTWKVAEYATLPASSVARAVTKA